MAFQRVRQAWGILRADVGEEPSRSELDVQALAGHLRTFLACYELAAAADPVSLFYLMRGHVETIRRDLEPAKRATIAD